MSRIMNNEAPTRVDDNLDATPSQIELVPWWSKESLSSYLQFNLMSHMKNLQSQVKFLKRAVIFN